MILIADSGSTKTDWRLIDEKQMISQARTSGLNPFFQSADNILSVLQNELTPQISGKIEYVYFYGAGCSTDENIETVSQAFLAVFPEACIQVSHDLLGAARATCGAEEGIACILGTGSNSCLYDGENILENIPALGYILGDEGSGAVMGKRLLAAFLNHELPDHLQQKFEKRYSASRKEILENVYKKPFPNRYLATFSRFLFHHLKDPYVYKFVYENFDAFIQKSIIKYSDYGQYKVHFVGSIAFYFSGILRQAAMDRGITVKNILETPIAGLTLYHKPSETV